MIHITVDFIVITLILIHISYLRKIHLEDIDRDRRYKEMIDEHIDWIKYGEKWWWNVLIVKIYVRWMNIITIAQSVEKYL